MATLKVPPPRRVLVTGVSSFWGGRLAQSLEADKSIETIVGIDTRDPTVELERTDFLRVSNYRLLERVIRECAIDTIVHSSLVVDPSSMNRQRMHETNVIGTMQLFAAASAPNTNVRRIVVKSSTMRYGSAPEDPVWFSETTPRSRIPSSALEKSLAQVEDYVLGFAEDNPDVGVTLLRFANVVGSNIETPLTRLLALPLVPAVIGFDPRFQFVHEDDVVSALTFALQHDSFGVYNVAGDGLLPWSEVAAICGKRQFPIPGAGSPYFASPFRSLGWFDLHPVYVNLLRYGRGVDNTKLKSEGFDYRYTSAHAVYAYVQAMRLRKVIGDDDSSYRYERDVDTFFRQSPAVVRNAPKATKRSSAARRQSPDPVSQ